MGGTRARLARLLAAAILVVPAAFFASTVVSHAAPSKADVAAAKERLDELEHQLEVAEEQYNDALVRLQAVQARLADAKRMKDDAEAQAAASQRRLSDRAVQAYTGMGSQIGSLLDAQNLGDFSDRLQFMGAIAQSDADLASVADASAQRAQWAADQYAQVVAERQANLDEMSRRLDEIQTMLSEQKSLYEQTNADYQSYVRAQELAAQQAAQAAREAAQSDGSDTSSSSTGDVGGYVPPPNATGAQIAIDAADSVLGTQYVWGSADPSVGFDCSGLTMWAWAQAGVSLPHSSAAQYAALPHVPLSDIQPGDLLFFYSPISHVALYVGGGMMIHARHPGADGEVQYTALSAYDPVVGAARPG
jgi:cell wall-associated NlpC family hydrolase